MSCEMPIPMEPITLTGGRVILRCPWASDAPALAEAVRESMAELMPWMGWCHPAYSQTDTDRWIGMCDRAWTMGHDREFVFLERDTGMFLGTVGINQVSVANNLANLGYWIRTSKTGQGLMTEACRLAVEFAFTQMELTRLEIVIQTENWPSRRVAERLGASLECIARNRLMHRGEPRDAAVYSLVPGEGPGEPR
jgi:ribosomal-protein-serine acetyltransferase